MDEAIDLAIPNDLSELARLHEPVRTLLEAAGALVKVVHRVKLVLEEMVSNVIRHGYADADAHAINVRVEVRADHVHVRITDDASPFNPLEAPPPPRPTRVEDMPIGGLGIHIVRQMTDHLAYHRAGERNILEARINR